MIYYKTQYSLYEYAVTTMKGFVKITEKAYKNVLEGLRRETHSLESCQISQKRWVAASQTKQIKTFKMLLTNKHHFTFGFLFPESQNQKMKNKPKQIEFWLKSKQDLKKKIEKEKGKKNYTNKMTSIKWH